MASDGASGGRDPKNRASANGFHWFSPAPSLAEIARLEALFPSVVRVPVEELESEMAGWHQRAVFARTYSRWVPAEAYIREFRRAGVSGSIVPISLAYRCHIFRFDDPAACEFVLSRPWVVNGQAVGTEVWRPEFFPAEDSIPFALLWVRLPNLPLEFWKEDILRMIVESAGCFVCSDASTQARNRGGFARVCVRVDLRRPLRPGTRVQGLLGPFWQQFAFESIEGFCPRCGSLHLGGPCSSSVRPGAEDVDGSSLFGPWLAAVRKRRDAAGPPKAGRFQPPSSPSPSGSVQQDSGPGSGGWLNPRKVARRQGPASRKVGGSTASLAVVPEGDLELQVFGKGSVPVEPGRAGSIVSAGNSKKAALVAASGGPSSLSLVSSNPFASLGSASVDGGSLVFRDANSGPLKRARPVEYQAPRSTGKSDKKKGKGKVLSSKCSADISSSLLRVVQSSGCQAEGLEVVLANPMRAAGVMVGQGSDCLPLDPSSSDVVADSAGMMAGSPQVIAGDTLVGGLPPDGAMLEELGGGLS